MIYVIESLSSESLRLERYGNLSSVTESLEWQDVHGGACVIISDHGVVHALNSTKQGTEHGTVCDYSLVPNGSDLDYSQWCRKQFEAAGWPDELENLKPDYD